MRDTPLKKFESRARDQIPLFILVCLTVLSGINFYLPNYNAVAINFPLIGIYYWSLHRPDLLGPIPVFFIGLLYDFLIGNPPGMSALIFVAIQGLIGARRKTLLVQAFWVHWLAFFGTVVVASFSLWLIGSIWYSTLMNPFSFLFQGLLTLSVFPLLVGLMGWLRIKLLKV